MVAGAWICLLAPLVGALTITAAGLSMSRRTAAYLATFSVLVAFGGAVTTFVALLGRHASDREHVSTAWTWLGAGS